MDDDQLIRPMLKKMLEHIRLNVFWVSDDEALLSEFTKSKESENIFNAIIMDLTIPGGMRRIKAAKIREFDNNIPSLLPVDIATIL